MSTPVTEPTTTPTPNPKPIKMTYTKWLETFKPVVNHLDKNAQLAGFLFESYGPELAHVKTAADDCIWTLVEGDSGKWYVVDEFHVVNRVGYLVATIPRKPNSRSYSIFYM